jgi:hypothetical protein
MMTPPISPAKFGEYQQEVLEMNPYLTGEQLRQWASKCLQEAKAVASEEERIWLQSMYDGLLDVAATQDWLEGRSPLKQLSNHSLIFR